MGISKDKPCPSCRSVGNDSTGNHLIVFGDGNVLCNRCNFMMLANGTVMNWGNLPIGSEITWETDPPVATTTDSYGSLSDSRVNSSSINDILQLPSNETDRGIKGSIMSLYGIRFEFNTSDRSIEKHYYPITVDSKIVDYKYRIVQSKDFRSLGLSKGMKKDLFGILSAEKKKGMHVVITEGELDAPSAYQMLTGAVPEVLCLSLTDGASSAKKCIGDNLEFLKNQASVTLCYDMDEEGYKATEETWKLLPSVRVMSISEKDANDMLREMKTTEFRNAYHTATPFRPKVLASVNLMEDNSCTSPVQMGLSYPWKALTNMTYGIHKNQVIGLGAAPKAGKTTLVRGIQQHLMFHHGQKIGIFSLEEKPEWTTRKLIGYIMNKQIHKPGVKYNQADAIAIKKQLENKAFFYEHKYYNGHWDEIESYIRYLHSIGVDFFFIDPLSALVSHLTPSEANKYLSEALYRLSLLVQQIDISVFHVNHLNTAESGKSHEAGARVYASQFTGSRAQWRYSHSLFGVERDILGESGDPDIMTIRFLGDREFDNTGACCQLRYNKLTGRIEDIPVSF